MLPFRHIAVMKSLTGPFRAGPATDLWARTDPFRKVIFTLLHTEAVCARASFCAHVGGGTAEGNVQLDVKDRNDGMKTKREDIYLPSFWTHWTQTLLPVTPKKGFWESMKLCNQSLVLFADLFWLCFMWVDEGNP